ncbi:hypothetical protein [Marinobacter sp. JSM 1782161]|uniref:hypothetical protein n=1 Tax=Marinobacter sp. JSM 1782161 TaxID=2685906 RepID=UPI001401C8AB|nr:hypothetical protein [Marinobacter sp. JSM 1782161]
MRPLFITGASRSGTSMTAGLFAQHGLWFGPCMKASRINPKGFFETQFIKQKGAGYHTPRDASGWEQWLADHGSPEQWAVKAGPEWWPLFSQFDPVVVCCYRDRQKIIESRERANFSMRPQAVDVAWRRMAEIPSAIEVWPDEFVAGDFRRVIPAFEALGVQFDNNVARSWVDPGLWNKG